MYAVLVLSKFIDLTKKKYYHFTFLLMKFRKPEMIAKRTKAHLNDGTPCTYIPVYISHLIQFTWFVIFSRQASLARQAFLITPLHGACYKTGKNAYAKK